MELMRVIRYAVDMGFESSSNMVQGKYLSSIGGENKEKTGVQSEGRAYSTEVNALVRFPFPFLVYGLIFQRACHSYLRSWMRTVLYEMPLYGEAGGAFDNMPRIEICYYSVTCSRPHEALIAIYREHS